jgi:hypothetical protein
MILSTAFEGYRWTALGAFGVALAIAGQLARAQTKGNPALAAAGGTAQPRAC